MAALDGAGRPALMHAAAANRHDVMMLLLLPSERVDLSVADATHGRCLPCGYSILCCFQLWVWCGLNVWMWMYIL